jgi:hypothetical protein
MITRSLAFLCASLLLWCLGTVTSAVADPGSMRVATYAGSGQLGMSDGDATRASFLQPAGLAEGRDGTVYVSDETGQRIRAISGGRVSTVAGSGAGGTLGLAVPGGYRDGAALEARFNHPIGMAAGQDGALYIADSSNAAVRKLQDGVVSTVAGKPDSTAAVDGDASIARFVRPRALALDGAGRLWIADFGGGLRCWEHGTLTTIPLTPPATDLLSVSVQPDDGTVLVATRSLLYQYTPNTGKSVAVSTGSATGEGDTPFGTPSQVAGIGHGQAIFTDAPASNIRYVRFDSPPFVTAPYTRVIAGGAFERHADDAGFADGASSDARFSSLRGLLVVRDQAIVADSGNHRIRILNLPQFRVPETGKNSEYQYDQNHYEVALVGPSWVFFDSHDGDSMCSYVERQLDASGKLTKPARCHTVRIDAGLVPATEDYISANLAFRHVDSIVMSIVPGRAYQVSPGYPQVLSLEPFQKSIIALLELLKPSNARLAIFWQYYDTAISNREQLRGAETDPAQTEGSPDAIFSSAGQNDAKVLRSLDGFAVTQCDSFEAAVAYEKGDGPPLYLPDNPHYTDRGNAFYGKLLGDCLARQLVMTK